MSNQLYVEAKRAERVGKIQIPTAIRKTRLTKKSTSRMTKHVQDLNEKVLKMMNNR
ncbi:hypothetical protein [Neobacillus ginsengisoli]|uniref:Uncharacterized protein n=1 Tax=Neobacillus ginsengisoli TaxID=904295 RepID=A0ABT9XWM1_9BACI|nr:hypothetical protein [Neobacillus ginsengisoli]MDQ0199975.1 hypothetical protein [Neobacillus ginsengisoli]